MLNWLQLKTDGGHNNQILTAVCLSIYMYMIKHWYKNKFETVSIVYETTTKVVKAKRFQVLLITAADRFI